MDKTSTKRSFFKVIGIFLLFLIIFSVYKIIIKDSIFKELSSIPYYLMFTDFHQAFEPVRLPLLSNNLVVSLLIALLSVVPIFLFGFWFSYRSRKDGFDLGLSYKNDIFNIGEFKFTPFPVDREYNIEEKKKTIYTKERKNRFVLTFPQDRATKSIDLSIIHKEIEISTLKILIVSIIIVLIGLVIKDYVVIKNYVVTFDGNFFFLNPLNDFIEGSKIYLSFLNFFADAFFLCIIFILAILAGDEIFKRKFSLQLGKGDNPRIVGNFLCVPSTYWNTVIFICPLERLDEWSIEYAKKVYNSMVQKTSSNS